jgi:hypothetical protein
VSDSWPPPQQPDEVGAASSGEGASAQPPDPPPYGQPQYGQPLYGQPPYGQPPPPSGDEATRPYGSPPYGGSFGQAPRSAYPQQELLPHDVKASRSRAPLVIGLVVALALVGGGIAAWLLLRDNGEGTRAQYCTEIKTVTQGGDITTALGNSPQAAMAELHKLVALAPGAVAGDYKTLTNLLESAQKSQSSPSITDALSALGALKSIVTDSNAHCGTTFKAPSLP